MKRFAIVATPAMLSDLRPAPGALDGDVVRARLPLSDTGFEIIDVDPELDLAEQVEGFFERGLLEPEATILFYASSMTLVSVDGELFIALDPSQPTVGDSVRDVALVFGEHARGPVAFVLECRHRSAADDPFRSALVVSAAKEALGSVNAGIELLVAARPLASEPEERPSPFTRELLEALDESDSSGLSLGRFYARARESERLLGVVPCFAHMRGKRSICLVLPAEGDAESETEAEAEAAAPLPVPASSSSVVAREVALAEESPARAEEQVLPRVLISDRPPRAASTPPPRMGSTPPPRMGSTPPPRMGSTPPPRMSSTPPPRMGSTPPPRMASTPPPRMSSTPPPRMSSAPPEPVSAVATYVAEADALTRGQDFEGALRALRRALGELGMAQSAERADIYLRLGQIKEQQDKRREAIANYEKALQLVPTHRRALETLLELNVLERDFRAVLATEERLLELLSDEGERFVRLVAFAERWERVADDAARARSIYERARELKPDELAVLRKLRHLYETAGDIEDAIATRRRIAELTPDPRAKSEVFLELGEDCLKKLSREELALEFLELSLESDPSHVAALGLLSPYFADRQEWSELEGAYIRMLGRTPRIADARVRGAVRWELYRRLGRLYHDHLEDPASALDAFDEAAANKPDDVSAHRSAAELARSLGRLERAAKHLEAIAALSPMEPETYHALFEVVQKLRLPDHAYTAASAAMFLRAADVRERFIYEENRPSGVLKFFHPLSQDDWDLFRFEGRDRHVERILSVVADAAVEARVVALAAEGRLVALDPALRQDPEQTTVSVARSVAWASRLLGVDAPAIYLHDDANVGLAAVIAKFPASVVGGRVLRGRSLLELAFLVGRHLGYYMGAHRLLLYFPSIEELSGCFLASVKLVRPALGVPESLQSWVPDLMNEMKARLSSEELEELGGAVERLEKAGNVADVGAWIGAVERAATRAGHTLAGDLDVAASVLKADGGGVLSAEDKLKDLLGFTVSDAHHRLREALGIAIEP